MKLPYTTNSLILWLDPSEKYIIRDKNGNSEAKLFNTKQELARNFIMDPAYKEIVDDLRSTLKAMRM